jgi:hypothetical protein
MPRSKYLINHGNNRKYKGVIASLTTSQIAQHSGYCASRSRRADIGGYGFKTGLTSFPQEARMDWTAGACVASSLPS